MIASELMCHVAFPYNWNDFLFHRGCSYDVQSIPSSRPIGARQTTCFTPINQETIQMNKNLAMTSPSREKYTITASGKPVRTRSTGSTLARAQDKGLQFHQTRSHAVIVHSSVLANCIYKVIPQKKKRKNPI